MLFFGCRSPTDHLYKEELEIATEKLSGSLSIFTAYSRFGAGKCRVQDKVKEEHESVAKMMLDEDGSIYFCGSTAMAHDVRHALSVALRYRQNWTEEQYAHFESERKRVRRWQEDVWG